MNYMYLLKIEIYLSNAISIDLILLLLNEIPEITQKRNINKKKKERY